jgi:hypothetical protein
MKSKTQQARHSGSQLLLSAFDSVNSTAAAAVTVASDAAVHAPSSGGNVGQHATTTANAASGDTASDTLSGSVRSSTRSLSKAISSRILSTKRQKRQAASALVTQWQQQQSNSSFAADVNSATGADDDMKDVEIDVESDLPKVEADVTGVYLFNSPRLFKQMLSLVLLFSNIEIALLAANFGIVTARDDSKSGATKFWTMLALLLPMC